MSLPDIIPQIQVTLDCNFCCAYCFQNHQKGIMDLSVVEAILEKTIAHNLENRHPQDISPMQIIWHGGEPLKAGIKFFQKIIQLESHYKGIRFQNRLQTNGSLMTEAFARFFADHDFHVGFSLDGPENIHDRYRRFRGSEKGSFKSVMKGIEWYRRFASPDRLPVIAVITRASVGRETEIFNFFKRLRSQVQLDIYDLRCLDMTGEPEQKRHLMELAPTPDDIGSFLIRLFDLWFHENTGQVDFSELRNEVRMILQPEIDRGDPFHKKRCDPGRMIFDPKGRVFSCDQYVNDAKTSLGNILADAMEDILNRKTRLWEEIKSHIRQSGDNMACSSCYWGRQHMGGCLTCMKYNALLLDARKKGLPDEQWYKADLLMPLKGLSGETYYCQGLQTFRNYAKQIVQQELSNA